MRFRASTKLHSDLLIRQLYSTQLKFA